MIKIINGIIFAVMWPGKWYWLGSQSKWHGPFSSEQETHEYIVEKTGVLAGIP